jgi:hypothetical protein
VGLPVLVYFRVQPELRVAHDELGRQALELDQLAARHRELTDQLTRLEAVEGLTREQFSELLKLRAEVGRLRGISNEVAGIRSRNEEIRTKRTRAGSTSLAAGVESTLAWWPVDQLTFSGYSDTFAALLSALRALKKRSTETFLSSLHPDLLAALAANFQRNATNYGAQDFQTFIMDRMQENWLAPDVKGIRVTGEKRVAGDRVELEVLLEESAGVFSTQIITLTRMNTQWVLSGR